MTRWAVVGAGAAGCVVAARLGEAGHDVTLIEAGCGTAGAAVHAASFFDAMAEPGRLFPGAFARGRGLGGSSAVNGMIAMAGDLAQYEAWGWHDAGEALARVKVPLEVARDDELGPMDRALLAAAPDAVKATLTRRDGRRVTAAEAYLPAPDVTLLADMAVDRVELDGTRAVGVRLADGRLIDADRVVVAAGAIGSPLLLRASGVDRPGIGHGLRNHPGLAITAHLTHGTSDGHRVVAASLLRRQDIQLVAMNQSAPDRPDEAQLLVVVMAPTGAGEVGDSAAGAVVDQVLDDHDYACLAAGAELALEVLGHEAVRDIVDDVRVGEAPNLVFHPTSTCRMGTVVDDDGAVEGCTGLYVVDASVFPDIPRANTYLPTLMLAERLAARLAAID